MPQEELIDVVDDTDTVIGRAKKTDLLTRGFNHRVIHIVILNESQEIGLQRRNPGIPYAPNCWTSTATGLVLNNETYRQAAQRIAKEYLGTMPDLKMSGKLAYRDPKGYTKYIGVFAAGHNGPFRINANDTAEIKFLPREVIEEMIASGNDVHPEFAFLMKS